MAKKTKDLNEDGTVVDETAAADSLHTHSVPPVSRSDVMAMAMDHISKLPAEDLSHFWTDALAASKNLGRGIPDGTSEKNKATLNMKPSHASAANLHAPLASIQCVKEDLDVILKDQDLPKEFVDKALVLFESAVNARVLLETAKIKDQAGQEQEAELEILVEKIDGYLGYAAEEFFKENQLAIESSLRLNLYEDFIDGLHELFANHYIEVPDGRTDVLEALGERVDELEEVINDRTAEVLALRDALDAECARRVFEDAAQGLGETDVENFKKLSETVEFVDGNEEDLAAKLKVIREAHFSKDSKKEGRKLQMVTENEGEVVEVEPLKKAASGAELVEAAGTEMAPYVAAMNRMAARRK